MAAPPSTASPVSWNPAVPPPPVTGAAVGNGLDGAGDGLAEGVAEGVALSSVEALSDALAGELVLALAEVPAEVLADVVTEVVALAVGENTVPDDEGVEGLEVQAASATQASTVVRPQPTAVSLTLCAVHAMAVRAFIEPPHALGNDHFPDAGRRNRRRKGKHVTGLCSLTASADEPGRRNNTVSPARGANRQWRAHQRNIRLDG